MAYDPLIDEDESIAREELRRIQEEETRRLQEEAYRYYEPNGKCEEYIKAVGSGDYFVVLFSAANGVGKTAATANIVANIAYKIENEYFKGLPLFEKWPYPKKGRIATDPANVSNVIAALKEWMPAGKYSTNKKSKPYESYWKTKTGFDFDIMTYEQNPKEFEGPTLGFVWFDEPPPEAIFKACVARLRKGGIIFISATPLTGSAWLYDHIIAGDTDDSELAELKSKKRINIEACVEDACIEHGVRGHLEHRHIEQMIAEYSEDEKQARVYGKFQHLVGLVFKQFSRNIHVIKPFAINFKDFAVYHALDTHPRNEDAGLWVAVDRQGTKFVIDELYIKVQGDEELATAIKQKNSQYRVVRKLIEPAAFIEDQHTQRSLASKLADNGLVYMEASKMREASDRRIEDALKYEQKMDYMVRAPEIYIFESCRRTIFEFEHYRWDDYTGVNADKHNKKEKKVDKDDHEIECLGRILIQEPKFISPPVRNTSHSDTPRNDPYD